MKKYVLLSLLLIFFCSSSEAQVNPHAIGVRLEGSDLFGAEASYQHGLSEKNRLEIDAGLRANALSTRIYGVIAFHWDWNIVSGFNWFVGPAVTSGFYQFDNNSDYINFGAGGQIGFEYDFNELGVPLLVSVDTRPIYDFVSHGAGFWVGASAGVRYTF